LTLISRKGGETTKKTGTPAPAKKPKPKP